MAGLASGSPEWRWLVASAFPILKAPKAIDCGKVFDTGAGEDVPRLEEHVVFTTCPLENLFEATILWIWHSNSFNNDNLGDSKRLFFYLV